MAFNDGFYYGDEDDVAFDKDVLISYWSKGWWGYNPHLHSIWQIRGINSSIPTETGTMFWEEHPKQVVVILKKRLPMQLLPPFRQLPSTTYPETSFADGR